MGGTVAFYAATLGTVGAAASFYGGGVATGRFGFAPVARARDRPQVRRGSVSTATSTKGIPVEQVEALRAAARGGVTCRPRSCATPTANTVSLRRAARRVYNEAAAQTPTRGRCASSPST